MGSHWLLPVADSEVVWAFSVNQHGHASCRAPGSYWLAHRFVRQRCSGPSRSCWRKVGLAACNVCNVLTVDPAMSLAVGEGEVQVPMLMASLGCRT